MRRLVRESSLSLLFALLFLASLVGQAFAGRADLNQRHAAEGRAQLGLGEYVASAHFAVDIAENWQSEYLQFLVFILATIWLVQRGSPESKPLGRAGRESDEEQLVGAHVREDSPAWARTGGFRTTVLSRSLGLVMGLVFGLSLFAQSLAGWVVHNEDRLSRLQEPLSWVEYVGSPDFWSRTLQNWQSEFLAVGSMIVLSIYLRERGSPESKPVGLPHDTTGVEG